MISRFFINRPIFAAVLSIVITLAGGISVFTLPLAQFPSVTPPTVQVTCNYPGASAKEVADSVAAPIEQQVNGVEGIMYMSSQCANDGSYNLTVTFHPGINLNVAQVLVQNRVNLAVPQLPDVIKATGVTTIKRSPDIVMGLAIHSPRGTRDQLYLSNFALMQIKDELARVQGVGDVFLFGQRDYSMRIWVNPAELAARRMSASDVVQAVREQNQQVATGAVGQEPISGRQESQVTLSTLGRLSEVEQFDNIVLKTGREGRITRVKDIGRVELGAKNQDIAVRLDGSPTVFLAIFQMPDANALDVRERVLAKMEELKKSFPDDVDFTIGFDTTPYTSESIKEVVKTLRDAIALVAIVVLLFLQNWRSAIIPLVAVPVAIVGTFAAMAAIGFSINNLTLFGLVLAIGIVVDDAIVVVEAVEHHIELGLAPREATLVAMKQVSGPVIAVGLVLSAVFVPCAFFGGITGAFFRQFALTIAVSTVISAFNSLTLSPALTALLLRPLDKETGAPLPKLAFVVAGGWFGWAVLAAWLGKALAAFPALDFAWIHKTPWLLPAVASLAGAMAGWLASKPLNYVLGRFFRGFNVVFRKATHGYTRLVGGLLRISVIMLVLYGGLLVLTFTEFQRTRRGFIPSQDMGYLLVNVQLPDSASFERSSKIMRQISETTRHLPDGSARPGIWHATDMTGQSFVLNAAGSNFGSMFINLEPYEKRRDPSLASDVIANDLRQAFAKIEGATVQVFGPPPVRGVGRAGGFAIMIEDRGDFGPQMLQQQVENLCGKVNMLDPKQTPWLAGPGGPKLAGLFSVFRANVPQLHVVANPAACMMRGVSLQDFADTLQIYEGSYYVNDFNRFGRTWQVIVQAEAQFRRQLEDLPQLQVRNSRGVMVPIGSLANSRESNGPLVLTRYNMYPAASINGGSGPGVSSGEAIQLMEHLAKTELPQSMAFEWTDMSYLELLAGNTAMGIFAIGVLMVFLVLAAQYESWSLPLAVILVVPMCVLSALTGVHIANHDINIFTQIGFVVLVGLASKNAILIVEFAKQQRHEGKSRREATLEACKLRLRPIIMTSFAFILGVLPLLLSHGAGAEMRRTLGTAVFSGMVGVTLFGIVFTPVFFFTIDWLGQSRLFAGHKAQAAGRVALDVLTLGLVRLAALAARQSARTGIFRRGLNGNGKVAARPAEKRPETIQQK
ncbi:MAG TPA: efflux RND transporter permease subunit [Gemmataceae bacterium]|nr:efflux RND transporter permease subunit [Gemmataceae bacterium]